MAAEIAARGTPVEPVAPNPVAPSPAGRPPTPSLTQPRRTVPLSVQVSDQIMALIERGDWALGSRIPPEHRLSADLGVSRNTVREALRSLVHSGILQARAGDGTYVRADSELPGTISRRVRRSPLADVFEVRSMIEERGARLAARHASAAELTALRTVLGERDNARTDDTMAGFVSADVAFHQGVVVSSGNALLSDLYLSITDAVSETVRAGAQSHGAGHEQDERHDGLDRRHHDLLDAIESGDADVAGALAVELVEESQYVCTLAIGAA